MWFWIFIFHPQYDLSWPSQIFGMGWKCDFAPTSCVWMLGWFTLVYPNKHAKMIMMILQRNGEEMDHWILQLGCMPLCVYTGSWPYLDVPFKYQFSTYLTIVAVVVSPAKLGYEWLAISGIFWLLATLYSCCVIMWTHQRKLSDQLGVSQNDPQIQSHGGHGKLLSTELPLLDIFGWEIINTRSPCEEILSSQS
jgi:hypothetical protein